MRFMDIWYTRIDAEQMIADLGATAKKSTMKAAEKNLAKARRKTKAPSGSLGEVRRAGRRRLPHPPAAAGDRPAARDGWPRPARAARPRRIDRLRGDAVARPAPRPRPLPLRGLRPEGRRRRIGGHRGVHGPADGRPRGRPAVPAGQGGERRRCSRRSPAPASTSTRASASCRASGSRRPRATRSWDGSPARVRRHREFYVRQLRDMKGSAAIEIDATRAPRDATASSAAATLARAHARTGDAAKIAGYLGEDDAFDRALERVRRRVRRPRSASP